MDNKDNNEINIPLTISYLERAFAEATRGMGKAARMKTNDGRWLETPLYTHQVQFSYMLNEIRCGPRYIVPKVIQECNEYIERIKTERKK